MTRSLIFPTAAVALLLATGCATSSVEAPATQEPAAPAAPGTAPEASEASGDDGAISRMDFEDGVAPEQTSGQAGAPAGAPAEAPTKSEEIERMDFEDAEAFSLLGRPLPAPELSEEFRAEQEAQLEKARADLAQRPDDPDAVIWVGRRTAYLGRYREAIEVYSQGIEAHPEYAPLYRHRGHRYITLRRFDDAIADLERATELIAGTPDQVEPDGLPNARGIPTSTSHSNIWYHLGLAHYLKGDFEKAEAAYRECMEFSNNPDMLSATSHWYYMTLKRLGKEREAQVLVAPIEPDFDVIENEDYYQLLLMYKGRQDPKGLLAGAMLAGGVRLATVGYGVGNWYLTTGQTEAAHKIFRQVAESENWAAFGTIAAEAELARVQ